MPHEIKSAMTAPSAAEIEALAQRALAAVPRRFTRHLRPVVIRVEEFPDPGTQLEMRVRSPFGLLGLYRGVPLPLKSVADPHPHIDMIYLYRRPILAYWIESGEPLDLLVRHVLIHEIGHHFGFSDAEMAAIEAED